MSAKTPLPPRPAFTLPPSAKDPATYEHVTPDKVGNKRKVLVSEQAGQAQMSWPNSMRIGIKADKDDPRIGRLLDDRQGARDHRLCL